MIAFDTETTGSDWWHGSQPYLVTICRDDGTNTFWQWDVDPETRQVIAPDDDLQEIDSFLPGVHRDDVVGQNIKFDCHAVNTLWPPISQGRWDWARCQDTLIAGHILNSATPHDLTSMVLGYMGEDIEPYEKRLEDAVKKARDVARRKFPSWAIAKKGREDMPSAKDKTWKIDSWLPRALRQRERVGPPEWETVLSDYANVDSAYTLLLWQVMETELHRRGLWDYYRERMRAVRVYWLMEHVGVTYSRGRLEELTGKYRSVIEEASTELLGIAATYSTECECAGFLAKCPRCGGAGVRPYGLELPKGNRNNSLVRFVFDVMNLPVIGTTESGLPSMREEDVKGWLNVLEDGTPQHRFAELLNRKSKTTKALQALESYATFGVPTSDSDTYVLHPQQNPTGTITLRGSSNNPNSQNVSTKEDDEGYSLRYVFGPAPGREWWAMDFENIELRIPAYEAKEPQLMALFEDHDKPPYYGSEHLLNFSVVFADVWQKELLAHGPERVGEVVKTDHYPLYKRTKNGDFALGYGAGKAKTDGTFGRAGAHDLLKSRFAKKEALNRYWLDFADRHGYVETIPDTSIDPKRGYPIHFQRSEYDKISPTEPLSYHVQSTACWAKARALTRCQDQLDEWRADDGYDGRILLDVHDEIVFDLPAYGKRNLPRVRRLRKLMEESGNDIGIPLSVSCEYCPDNWSQGEEP